jgi:hypothetical protein
MYGVPPLTGARLALDWSSLAAALRFISALLKAVLENKLSLSTHYENRLVSLRAPSCARFKRRRLACAFVAPPLRSLRGLVVFLGSVFFLLGKKLKVHSLKGQAKLVSTFLTSS